MNMYDGHMVRSRSILSARMRIICIEIKKERKWQQSERRIDRQAERKGERSWKNETNAEVIERRKRRDDESNVIRQSILRCIYRTGVNVLFVWSRTIWFYSAFIVHVYRSKIQIYRANETRYNIVTDNVTNVTIYILLYVLSFLVTDNRYSI